MHAGIPPPGPDTPPGANTPPGPDTPLGPDPHWEQTPPGTRTPTPGPDPPQEADSSIRSTSGRYASYWNAFLFNINSIIDICSSNKYVFVPLKKP